MGLSGSEHAPRRFLGPGGEPVSELPDFARDPADLVPLYEAMVFARAFDEKAVALQRTGQLGTYASALGQEAISVGVASAMTGDDVLLPSFRDHGAQLWRGVTPTELFLYWGGDERGSDFEGPRQDFPVSIPVASQFPHAAGVALGLQLKGTHAAAVAIGGDGSTSKGDFYEALNAVGVWRLPAVFVVANNQYAISVPRAAQTAAETLAQKAVAAGLPGEQVDGNDIIAVREAMERALARARAGKGGTLLEAVTYRLADHTTADDASRYREEAEVSAHWPEEPIARLRTYLLHAGAWSKESEETLLKHTKTAIDETAATYLATPPQEPESIVRYLYAALPADLERQWSEAGSGPQAHG